MLEVRLTKLWRRDAFFDKLLSRNSNEVDKGVKRTADPNLSVFMQPTSASPVSRQHAPGRRLVAFRQHQPLGAVIHVRRQAESGIATHLARRQLKAQTTKAASVSPDASAAKPRHCDTEWNVLHSRLMVCFLAVCVSAIFVAVSGFYLISRLDAPRRRHTSHATVALPRPRRVKVIAVSRHNRLMMRPAKVTRMLAPPATTKATPVGHGEKTFSGVIRV